MTKEMKNYSLICRLEWRCHAVKGNIERVRIVFKDQKKEFMNDVITRELLQASTLGWEEKKYLLFF